MVVIPLLTEKRQFRVYGCHGPPAVVPAQMSTTRDPST